MDKNKFTKGKWYIEDDAVISDTKDMGNIVCLAPIGFNDSMDKWEANALLISKAPELLQMLHELIKANPHHIGFHEKIIKANKLIKEATEL